MLLCPGMYDAAHAQDQTGQAELSSQVLDEQHESRKPRSTSHGLHKACTHFWACLCEKVVNLSARGSIASLVMTGDMTSIVVAFDSAAQTQILSNSNFTRPGTPYAVILSLFSVPA